MDKNTLFQSLEQAVRDHSRSLIERTLNEVRPGEVELDGVLEALCRGLDSAREGFKHHLVSMPEFLLSVDVFREALRALNAMGMRRPAAAAPARVVIGVVEGDVHDLGKNIVAGVLEAYGYNVVDLGRDVPARLFVEEARKQDVSLLALSCMMSTPLEHMKEVIRWSRREVPGVPIIVGGAVLDAELAVAIGADGYAESAGTVPEEARRLLAPRT